MSPDFRITRLVQEAGSADKGHDQASSVKFLRTT
ncbi:hypothetical protein APTSU1_001184800 [Apodemus speciosus]|uniref:Uncharacterized protein n=1 Tax=Apodemus speciosus TaxID=105296 RepID=A0ABQ0FBI1_APOSI